MTEQGWRECVEKAATDATLRDLLVALLTEQDEAKSRLQQMGIAWIGLPWLKIVEEVEALQNRLTTAEDALQYDGWPE